MLFSKYKISLCSISILIYIAKQLVIHSGTGVGGGKNLKKKAYFIPNLIIEHTRTFRLYYFKNSFDYNSIFLIIEVFKSTKISCGIIKCNA